MIEHKKILISSDHAGFELKEELISYIKDIGLEVEDCGPFEYKSEDDYPDFIKPVAQKISENPSLKAIIIGKSGQGEAMCANRFKKVRAMVYNCLNLNIIKLSREDNDSNILSLGAGFITTEDAQEAVRVWLETPFLGEERHLRRIHKIDEDIKTIEY
ncbi:MAG: RpiB/LacA/LacB family sugar-phosphate isomerase [Patescibacteria group bacterium]